LHHYDFLHHEHARYAAGWLKDGCPSGRSGCEIMTGSS
jgi:hypothetical protein